jgi:hypothetical protein
MYVALFFCGHMLTVEVFVTLMYRNAAISVEELCGLRQVAVPRVVYQQQ